MRLGVSIHARLATGDRMRKMLTAKDFVSIHARLATGDFCKTTKPLGMIVSIHARLATGDLILPCSILHQLFQFTPVLRRATSYVVASTAY